MWKNHTSGVRSVLGISCEEKPSTPLSQSQAHTFNSQGRACHSLVFGADLALPVFSLGSLPPASSVGAIGETVFCCLRPRDLTAMRGNAEFIWGDKVPNWGLSSVLKQHGNQKNLPSPHLHVSLRAGWSHLQLESQGPCWESEALAVSRLQSCGNCRAAARLR